MSVKHLGSFAHSFQIIPQRHLLFQYISILSNIFQEITEILGLLLTISDTIFIPEGGICPARYPIITFESRKYPCPIRSGLLARFFGNNHTVYQRVLMPLQDECMDSDWKGGVH
jgi:hypothetical protein